MAKPSLEDVPPKLVIPKIVYEVSQYKYMETSSLNGYSLQNADVLTFQRRVMDLSKVRDVPSLRSWPLEGSYRRDSNVVNVLVAQAEGSMLSTSFAIPRR